MSQNLRVEEERSKDKTLMKDYLHLRRQGRKLKQNRVRASSETWEKLISRGKFKNNIRLPTDCSWTPVGINNQHLASYQICSLQKTQYIIAQ